MDQKEKQRCYNYQNRQDLFGNIGIIGTGSALPEMVLSNDDLAEIMDTSDEWIQTRTGIGQRHIATKETTVTLAVKAAKRALEMAGITGDEIDLIIATTVTPDYRFPSVSCLVQREIGAAGVPCFDLSAACSGFIYAVATAYKFLQTGVYRHVLVVSAETLSRLVDWSDRSTAVLFGDGAGAVVLGPKQGSGLLVEELGADGARAQLIVASDLNSRDGRYLSQIKAEELEPDDPRQMLVEIEKNATPYMTMDGREVYKFTTTTVVQSIRRVMESAGLESTDISKFILHQANSRIIDAVAKRMKAPMEKFPMSIHDNANTSSSTVPILLDNLVRAGAMQRGERFILSGFGAGLTWASALLTW